MRQIEVLNWKSWPLRIAGVALTLTGLALLPLMMTGCRNAAAGDSEEKTKLVEVETTSPQRKDLTRQVQQPGWLKPYEVTPIYTKIAGFAEEPKYDIGDHVRSGALMVDLYVPEVVQDLNVKKAKVEQAKADVKQAKETAEAAKQAWEAAKADVMAKDAAIRSADAEMVRWQAEVVRADGLLAKGLYDQATRDQDFNQYRSSVAKKDEATANRHSAEASKLRASAYYNKTLADIEVAAASLDVAKAARDQWRDWLAYSQITAPYDGVVTLRNVHKGHFLQPSNSGSTSKAAEPLFVMMRTDIMRCTVDVPELDSVLVKDGDEAIIQFDAMPGVKTFGTVTRNAASLDDRTRTLRVEVWLEPKGATLKYTTGTNGVITYVDPIPPNGGTGYPRNATIPLLIPSGSGGIVNATTNAAGAITGVDPIPREGGAGYPRNATIPLPIAGGTGGTVNATTNAAGVVIQVDPIPSKGGTGYKRDATVPLSIAGGTGGVVNATTNAAGEVVGYTLNSGGRLYTPGTMTEDTICDVLRPFMYAHVTILGKIRNAWELPADTVVSDILAHDNRPYCFVVENGKAQKLFLQVGANCDEGLQILRKQRSGHTEWENITGQELVVATNSNALQDGQEVHVKTPDH